MDIIGQKKALEFLSRDLSSGRLASSYLFTGPGGVGKRQTAVLFAKVINCENNDIKNLSCCNNCLSCKKIDGGVHPDVVFVTRGEDKSSIGVDQVREIIRGIQFKNFEGAFRIIIIDDAHLLKIGASNALLKTLEEPPAQTIIILITSRTEFLPKTIISRCRSVRFGLLSDEDIKIILKSWNVSDEEIEILQKVCCGSLSLAKTLIEKGITDTSKEISDTWSNISSGNRAELFNLSKKLSKERDMAVLFVDLLYSLIPDDIEIYEKASETYREVILETKEFLQKNVNVQLALDTMFIKLME